MPLSADTPKVMSKIEADYFEVTRFEILVATTSVMVHYNAGIRQQDGSIQYVLHDANFEVSVRELMNASPNGAKTWYENLKGLVYNLGKQAGVFPNGTLT